MTWDGKPIDWGSLNMWAELLTAVGTVGAVIAAVWIAAAAARRAAKAEAKAQRAEELAEASLVTVRIEQLLGFDVMNNSGHAIRDVRVYAMTPGNPVYETPAQAALAAGATSRFTPADRHDANAAANHAAMFRNRAGHWWGSFAGTGAEQLPDNEMAARERVAKRLAATFKEYQARAARP